MHNDKFEKKISSSADVELAAMEIGKLKNIVELKLIMNHSGINDHEVLMLIHPLNKHKNIERLQL